MTPKKVFYAMTGSLVVVAGLLGATVYFGNQSLQTEADKLVDLKAINETLEAQQTNLLKAQRDIQKYSDIEEITQSIVPQDKDQARAVREMVTLAGESGFELQSVTFPSSNLGSTQNSGSNKKSNQSSGISQAVPVPGINGVYSLEATLQPKDNITYPQFLTFLKKLENNRRTSQVSRVRIAPADDSNRDLISFTLTIKLFLKP